MSDLPDGEELQRLIAGSRKPAGLSREDRIRLLGSALLALERGQMPTAEQVAFLTGAMLGWLRTGGNLERDYFKIVRPQSHITPSAVWRQIEAGLPHLDERQPGTARK